jgi:hypothetical protein
MYAQKPLFPYSPRDSLNFSPLEPYHIRTKSSDNETSFYLSIDNKMQKIGSTREYMTLHFYGDIDGDGIKDYIIGYDDKTHTRYLFLSSCAEKGQLFKAVAAYWAGYCC